MYPTKFFNRTFLIQEQLTLSVKTGDIVIFPEWCEHQALPNEDDAPRIILGTNYFLTGTFGDYDNKDETLSDES